MQRSKRFALAIMVSLLAQAAGGPPLKADAPFDDAVVARRLVAAAAAGDLDTLKGLLQKGPDIDGRDGSGLTPLLAARLHGQAEVEDFLVRQGANTHAAMPAPGRLIDELLKNRVSPGGAGAAVLVARDGTILFEGGYGLADIERRVPVTPATKFRIGSITKQFTASALLKLQEAGKLHVTDKLSTYYPDFPGGRDITLQNLLTHTSGIHSYTDEPGFLENVAKPTTTEDLVASIKRFPPDFKPGERWSYSNSNYIILGDIVGRVSGENYDSYLRKALLAPLGMTSTGVYRNDNPPSGAATGYGFQAGRYAKSIDWDMSWAGGAGSLYSTVEDLFRWNEGIFGHKVLDDESLKAALTPVVTLETKDKGSDVGYGYGWGIARFRGARVIWHNGRLDGFLSYILRLPDKNLTVAVLINSAPQKPGTDPDRLAHELVELSAGGELAPLPPKPTAVSVARETLAAIVGRYDYNGPVMTITQDGDRVFAQLALQPRFEIYPKSDTEFFWKVVDAQITFVKDASGKVVGAVHHQGGGSTNAPRLPDLAEIKLTDAQTDPMLGIYDFDSTGKVTATISRDEGLLYAQLTGQPRFEMGATSEAELFLRQVNARVTFIKDADGKVRSLIQHQNGHDHEWLKEKSP